MQLTDPGTARADAQLSELNPKEEVVQATKRLFEGIGFHSGS
jgi:hypothetical protein